MGASKLVMEPFHRGAEANLFLSTIHPWKVVVKQRISKAYRNGSLDDKIRSERTLSEVSIMRDAKAAGVKVPSVTGVQPETNTFSMTFIDGSLARDCLDGMSSREATKLFEKLGAMIGLMHSGGIVHGDLTTSNILVTLTGDPFLVDFGMARRSVDAEDRGVDLHLLQRSIVTSHLKDASPLVKALATGYSKTAGRAIHESSWAKAREISRRGRYFAIR
jgi:TP53 regulating kinase and related kinases